MIITNNSQKSISFFGITVRPESSSEDIDLSPVQIRALLDHAALLSNGELELQVTESDAKLLATPSLIRELTQSGINAEKLNGRPNKLVIPEEGNQGRDFIEKR
jgi:archaellin